VETVPRPVLKIRKIVTVWQSLTVVDELLYKYVMKVACRDDHAECGVWT